MRTMVTAIGLLALAGGPPPAPPIVDTDMAGTSERAALVTFDLEPGDYELSVGDGEADLYVALWDTGAETAEELLDSDDVFPVASPGPDCTSA